MSRILIVKGIDKDQSVFSSLGKTTTDKCMTPVMTQLTSSAKSESDMFWTQCMA